MLQYTLGGPHQNLSNAAEITSYILHLVITYDITFYTFPAKETRFHSDPLCGPNFVHLITLVWKYSIHIGGQSTITSEIFGFMSIEIDFLQSVNQH